jgi:DNA repair protein RecO (recombination protein O)
MGLKIDGIVLRKLDYSETSVIIKVLTREEGVKDFIFQGAKRKNKKGNLISPLAIISIEYYQRNDSDLAKITSVEAKYLYKSIPFDPYKSSIIFFMNEVLNNTIKEKAAATDLYDFLLNILQILDLSDKTSNYPIKFLYRLTKYLGFYPNEIVDSNYLDLKEGTYCKYSPNHGIFLNKQLSEQLLIFSKLDFNGQNDPKISLTLRRDLIYSLLKYYGIIIDNFKPIQSLQVLESTFHD